jgi:hypothetical protein
MADLFHKTAMNVHPTLPAIRTSGHAAGSTVSARIWLVVVAIEHVSKPISQMDLVIQQVASQR